MINSSKSHFINNLGDIEHFLKILQKRDIYKIEGFWILFLQKNGIQVFSEWLNECQHLQDSGKFKNGDKNYCGLLLFTYTLGCASKVLREQMVAAGFRKKLMKFVFTPNLFNDTELASDMMTVGLLTQFYDNQLNGEDVLLILQKELIQLFGSDLIPVRNRYRLEKPGISKLVLGSLLVSGNLSDSDHFDGMTLRCEELHKLRDAVLRNAWILDVSLSTPFIGYTGYSTHVDTVLKLFNILALSQPNRQCLCDRQSFESLFFGVSMFNSTSDETERTSKFCEESLRGLYMIDQSCAQYKTYMSTKQWNGECCPKVSVFFSSPRYWEFLFSFESADV